jgi:hypothetical protein
VKIKYKVFFESMEGEKNRNFEIDDFQVEVIRGVKIVYANMDVCSWVNRIYYEG